MQVQRPVPRDQGKPFLGNLGTSYSADDHFGEGTSPPHIIPLEGLAVDGTPSCLWQACLFPLQVPRCVVQNQHPMTLQGHDPTCFMAGKVMHRGEAGHNCRLQEVEGSGENTSSGVSPTQNFILSFPSAAPLGVQNPSSFTRE